MKCDNRPTNTGSCNCTYEPCPRKGICCECIRYHLPMRQAPACFFSPLAERSYDRSFKNLASDLKGR